MHNTFPPNIGMKMHEFGASSVFMLALVLSVALSRVHHLLDPLLPNLAAKA